MNADLTPRGVQKSLLAQIHRPALVVEHTWGLVNVLAYKGGAYFDLIDDPAFPSDDRHAIGFRSELEARAMRDGAVVAAGDLMMRVLSGSAGA